MKKILTVDELLGLYLPETAHKTYRGYLTPDNFNYSKDVAVFGSNTQGRHGKGTALICKLHFGAIYGQASGLQGYSWGMITTDLTKKFRPSVSKLTVLSEIKKLYDYAIEHPDNNFKVMYQGMDAKNLSGFTNQEFAEMFSTYEIPDNIIFEEQFNTLVVRK